MLFQKFILTLYLLCGWRAFPAHSLQPSSESSSTRRQFFGAAAIGTVALSPSFRESSTAWAAAPITQNEAELGTAKFLRLLRPNPPKILRQRLEQNFAVLLMRTSYSVTDDLDFVAMNQFQRDFFLIRSAEYEPYVQSLGPGFVKQGDLADPSYFDFISFAQYLTINREISVNPPMVFEEMKPVDQGPDNPQKFEPVVIRRDPSIPNNKLASEHDKRVGSVVLQYLDETYGNTPTALPSSSSNGEQAPIETVQAGLDQLVKLFLINGFAFGGNTELVSSSKSGYKFCLSLKSPATLWGGQSLQVQKSELKNDFVMKTAKQFVQRMGYRVASASTKYEGNTELNFLTIQ